MIHLDNVTKYFDAGGQKVGAVLNATLVIPKGRMVCLTGRNGAGKTTLMLLMAGLISPTTGRVLMDGQDISLLTEKWRVKVYRQKIGMIFQERFLLPRATVLENLTLPLIPMNMTPGRIQEKADSLLEAYGLSHKKKTLCGHLSGGEKQRLMIARALVHDPEILFADEPTTHLDEAVLEMFKEHTAAWICAGKTVVVATHQNNFLFTALAPLQIHMEQGRITDPRP